MQTPATQQPSVINVTNEGTVSYTNRQDIEIIPENPSKEIVLKIEDIPPLDVFYSPKHRVVVRKDRKKRKIDQSLLSSSHVELMNVVWKDSKINPSEDLIKLSQYAGAYMAATIDKASKVSHLMKEKDQKIALLEEKETVDQKRIT